MAPRKPGRRAPVKRRGKLTKKQLAQRKYAGKMRGVRKRAKVARKGKGRIAKRAAATKLRRKLGLKSGRSRTRKTKK